MTDLLPEVVRRALDAVSDHAAAQSFGVVALVLLIVVLLEHQLLRAAGARPAGLRTLSAAALPLVVAVVLTLTVRVVDLLP